MLGLLTVESTKRVDVELDRRKPFSPFSPGMCDILRCGEMVELARRIGVAGEEGTEPRSMMIVLFTAISCNA